MGLHTGGAEQSGESLVGLGINRAARLAALAHGGQILASSLVRDQLDDHPVEGVTLRDLGEHRLKDLSAPVRIVQVIADGLPSDFPRAPVAGCPAEQPADPADDLRRSRRGARGGRRGCWQGPGC